ILVVPCQFGLRHRGRSIRRAREAMTPSEFALGAFAAGMMLLTHPERLQHDDDLSIDCPGDKFSGEGSGEFEFAPYFSFRRERVGFDAHWCGIAQDVYGSASAFLPQCTLGS